MTITSETTRVKYTCDGTTTVYAYPFKIYEDDDLLAVKTLTATGAETPLILNTDYTVSGAGVTGGGNLTLTAGSVCPSGYTMTILRNIELTQETDYVDGQAFSAESLESAIDKMGLIQQQQAEAIGRAPKLPKTSSITDIALPNPAASHYIGWNAGATHLENKTSPVALTEATQYEVDALVTYGDGTEFTQATIEAALTAIGTTDKATLLLRPGTWVISSNVDWSAYTNVTFKIVPGAVISHGAFTVNLPNLGVAFYQVFSGTGTVTLSGSVKEVYPEWFGPNVTPGTTDMTAEIQDAVTAAGAIAPVYISETTYLISGTITLGTGSTITGGGDPSAIQNSSPNVKMLYAAAKNNILIRNIKLLGAAVTDGDSGIYIDGGDNIRIESVTAGGFKYWPIVVTDNAANVTITKCVAYGSTAQSGIAVTTGSNKVIVTDNISHSNYYSGIIFEDSITDGIISNNVVYANKTGIYDVSNTGTIISGNSVKGAGSGTTGGIVAVTATNTLITGNSVDGHQFGIQLYKSITNVTADGNTITNSAYDGIYQSKESADTVANVTISNNIVNKSCVSGGQAGITITNGTYFSLLDNVIYDTNGLPDYYTTASVISFTPRYETDFISLASGSDVTMRSEQQIRLFAFTAEATVSNTAGEVFVYIDAAKVATLAFGATATPTICKGIFNTITVAANTGFVLKVANTVDNTYTTNCKVKFSYF